MVNDRGQLDQISHYAQGTLGEGETRDLEAALRQLPTVQASPGLPERVMASIQSQSGSIWDLATLGRPMV